MTGAKLQVPIVTLSTKDNVNLKKQLSNGFKRSVYCSSYQTISAKVINQGNNIYELLIALIQGDKISFVLAYAIDAGAANNGTGIKNYKMYFLPRGEINNYNVLTDGRNFHDRPINELIKQ